ncbi:MAG: serine hydrolase domain-containing protein [Hyphomonadaceae bacterium]
MTINRRDMIGAAATIAALAAVASPAYAARNRTGGSAAHDKMLKKLEAYGEEHRANWGLPGLTISVVDRQGFSGFVRTGWADIDRKIPIGPDHLCQVGSITKMMVALTFWSMVEEGKLSPDTPFFEALPGIKVKDGEAITLQHLLNHTSGMPNVAPYFSELGGLWSSYTPGTHWNYCNIGYALLGLIIGRADGRSFEEAVTARVFKPLGMNDSVGAIRSSDRDRYPIGYIPYITDHMTLRPSKLAPAAWADVDNAAGSIAATGADMAKFMRFLLSLAEGKGSGVFSDATAVKFLANPADAPAYGKGVTYGNGVGHYPIDGRNYFHHTGGMVSVVSSLHVDPEAGVAAFVSTNIGYAASNYRPRDISLYACNLLRSLNAGVDPPAPKPSRPIVENPARYAGVYTNAAGDRIEVKAGKDTLTLSHRGAKTRMQDSGGGMFACEAPEFEVTGLMFDMEGEKAVRAWSGDVEYAANPAAGFKPPASPELAALAGRYDGTRIYARDGALWRNNREKLIPLPNGDYRPDPEWSPERVRFDGIFAGRPQRMLSNGAPSWRVAFL